MKTYTPDLTYFGEYPDPPGPEKIVIYLRTQGWLWDRVWQPRWKNWLFGPKWGWFGPVGTSWFMHTTPKVVDLKFITK